MAGHWVGTLGVWGRVRHRFGASFLLIGLLLPVLSHFGCAATPHGGPDPVPCGPSSWPVTLRSVIPQQFGGTDFRPACRYHDRCYGTSGAQRSGCDDGFREQLQQACGSSRHPALCRLVAAAMHGCVVICGEPRYRLGQQQSGSFGG